MPDNNPYLVVGQPNYAAGLMDWFPNQKQNQSQQNKSCQQQGQQQGQQGQAQPGQQGQQGQPSQAGQQLGQLIKNWFGGGQSNAGNGNGATLYQPGTVGPFPSNTPGQ